MEEQRTILARKTYALDTAWWRENYCVKLAKTTSYIQYRLIQQSRSQEVIHNYLPSAILLVKKNHDSDAGYVVAS